MVVLDLITALAAAAVAGVALFLAHGRRDDDRGGPRAELVRYLGVASIAALACAAANMIEIAGGGRFAAAAGNAANILAVGLTWVGTRRLNARASTGVVSAGAAAILMLAVTFVLPLDDATLLKTAGVAAFAALAAGELQRRPLRDLAGTRVLMVALTVFGTYHAYRVVVAATAGMSSPLWNDTASAQLTALLSALTIAAMGYGAVRLGRELDDNPSPGTRAHDRGTLRHAAAKMLRSHARIDVMTVQVPEIELIRAAHSRMRADEILTVLVDATQHALPGASAGIPTRDTVFVLLATTAGRTEVEARVRRAFTAQMPLIDYSDTPDLSFEHHPITEVRELSALMDARRPRAGGGAIPLV